MCGKLCSDEQRRSRVFHRYSQIVSLARSNKLIVVPTFATRHLSLAFKVAVGGKEVRSSDAFNLTYSKSDCVRDLKRERLLLWCNACLMPIGASSGVQAVKAAWAEKTITHFRVSYKRLHGDTDFERWMTADAPYNVWNTDAE